MYPRAVPRRPWRNGSGTCRWFPDAMVAPVPGRDVSGDGPARRPGDDRAFRRKNRVKQRRLGRHLCAAWDEE